MESDEKLDQIEHFYLGLPFAGLTPVGKPFAVSLTGKTQSGNMALC
jgi:hypothetical protein